MATRGAFNYIPNRVEAIQILRERYPDVDFGSLSSEQRRELLRKAVEKGLMVIRKEVLVLSLRDHPLTLENGGAQLCLAPSSVDLQCPDFRSPLSFGEEGRTNGHLTYYREVEDLVRRLLGPEVVHAWCYNHIIRRSSGTTAIGETAGPVRFVHNDYTEEYDEITRKHHTSCPSARGQYFRRLLRQQKGLEFTEEQIAKYRLVVLNTWRPITAGPLRRDPLAVCDARTICRGDLERSRTDIAKLPNDEYSLEVYLSWYSDRHRWHYVPNFISSELLVFKTFDSDMRPFIPTMHSAFELPGQKGAPPRESIEARVICLLERPPASKL